MTKQYATYEEYLSAEYVGPRVATDVIIRYNYEGRDGIVLIERKHEPFGIALPGGNHERRTTQQNAIKEGREETGLEIVIDQKQGEVFHLDDYVDRDPRAYVMSVTYTGRGTGVLAPHPDEDAARAIHVPYDQIAHQLRHGTWAFEAHKRPVRKFLRELDDILRYETSGGVR